MANFLVILLAILSSIKGYKLYLAKGLNSWQATEFMISYDSGFIRRGLIGTIFKPFLTNIPEININLITLIFSLFAIWLLVYIISLQASLKNTLNKTAIVLSPLFYPLFFFNDPQGGGRKEVFAIIFICLLSILKYLIPNINKRIIYLIWSISLPFLVLSHEASFFFLAPYLLFNIFLFELNSEINSGLILYKNIFLFELNSEIYSGFTLLKKYLLNI